MDLTPKQQASEAIRQANTILIATGQRPSIDQVTAVLSLAMILRKLGKKVTAVVSDSLPSSLNFLAISQLDKNLEGLRDFIMKVDLSRAEVDKLKYTIEDGKLNVHVTPFKGGFSQSDVSFGYGAYHYDLIVALGVPSRSKLDRLFSQNPHLLGSIPLLNLDFHRINENYGAVNLIEPTASSLSEMLVALAESLQNGLIDEPIATTLLTGIVASTDRFTANHTTPKALTVAAQLMAAGGKQQQIVKALYQGGQRDGRPAQKNSFQQPVRSAEFTPTPEVTQAPVVSAPITPAAPVTPAIPTPPPIQSAQAPVPPVVPNSTPASSSSVPDFRLNPTVGAAFNPASAFATPSEDESLASKNPLETQPEVKAEPEPQNEEKTTELPPETESAASSYSSGASVKFNPIN